MDIGYLAHPGFPRGSLCCVCQSSTPVIALRYIGVCSVFVYCPPACKHPDAGKGPNTEKKGEPGVEMKNLKNFKNLSHRQSRKGEAVI